MNTKKIFFISLIFFLSIFVVVFLISNYSTQSESSQIQSDETDLITETGKPCTSNEEWHQKADQIGFWVDGILVDEIISNTEILWVLNSYGIEDNKKVKIYDSGWDAAIGYYIEANESQFQEIQTNAEAEKYTWNLSFNSPGYNFISPSNKKKGDIIFSPVFLLNSGFMSREQISQNLISRGINVKRAKVVYLDIFYDYNPEEREQLLSDLNNDSQILFAFKEYMSGDIC